MEASRRQEALRQIWENVPAGESSQSELVCWELEYLCSASSASLCAITITALLLGTNFALCLKMGVLYVGDAEELSGGNLK